jgi:transcriptional regulator GlxA family with amidase domain
MGDQRVFGAVLFEGFELLDVFGPFEAFGMLLTRGSGEVRLTTVAERRGPVASAQQISAMADHDFSDCPKLDVILVPGGIGTRAQATNAAMMKFLRERADQVQIFSSVCTGAGLLACAGLLDGRRATTNKAAFAWVKEQGPKTTWVPEARWVEDGKFTTSAGVSAGIDMALAIVAKLYGVDTAEKIAVFMEYEWHRDATWDPFAKLHGLV